jgi:two-component system sensor histidine kinase/response regulator
MLANAVKFTDHRHASLIRAGASRGRRDALLRFEVADTGIGIAPEALPRLFDAFEQADNSTTPALRRHRAGAGDHAAAGAADGRRRRRQQRARRGQHVFWFTARA